MRKLITFFALIALSLPISVASAQPRAADDLAERDLLPDEANTINLFYAKAKRVLEEFGEW